ncbi:hypothetical protein D9611_011696 [Ephemerocybe angulata]|uniref:F-box domain-containing protein n=1 Tax=Ephemerocybe angulata TaxID=980116 RepID=A0A8H5C7G5_9AGAR|nr:hypothetical protein D9611_011696 [Tulosesus angulatus]
MTLPVPLELLLTIFDFAVHTSYDPADQPGPPSLDMLIAMEEGPIASAPATSGPTGIHKETEYPELQLQPGIIAHTTNPFTPLHISHVCKDWRDAAFSAPELWSSIYVADGRPNTYPLLRLWLQNSGSQPLDIVFRDTLNGSSGDTIVELIQMAAEQSMRWRTFKVRLRRQKLSIKEVAKVLHGIVTPLLQTLAFSFNTLELGDTQFDDLWPPPPPTHQSCKSSRCGRQHTPSTSSQRCLLAASPASPLLWSGPGDGVAMVYHSTFITSSGFDTIPSPLQLGRRK